MRDEEGARAVVLPGRRGGRHSRRELAELFWPHSDERRARADLRSSTLTRLRKTLGEDGARRSDDHRYFQGSFGESLRERHR